MCKHLECHKYSLASRFSWHLNGCRCMLNAFYTHYTASWVSCHLLGYAVTLSTLICRHYTGSAKLRKMEMCIWDIRSNMVLYGAWRIRKSTFSVPVYFFPCLVGRLEMPSVLYSRSVLLRSYLSPCSIVPNGRNTFLWQVMGLRIVSISQNSSKATIL